MIESDDVAKAIENARQILNSKDTNADLSKLHSICKQLQSSSTDRYTTCGLDSDVDANWLNKEKYGWT
jgi:hypothetical protein